MITNGILFEISIKRYLLSFLFVSLAVAGYSQQYNFKTYSVNKGLPHTQVHDIIQTPDGFLWAGTFGGGLAKFDGYNFTNFTTKDGLSSNSVESLYHDREGNLWVGTYQGGVGIMVKDSIQQQFEGTALAKATVLKMNEVQESGEIWFGTVDKGLFLYHDGSLRQLTTEDGLMYNTVWDFWQAPNGDVWIATQRGISIYDGESFTNITTSDGLSGKRVFELMEGENGLLWIATDNGISMWDGKQFIRKESLKGVRLGYVYDLLTDSDGSVWIATETQGVFRYSDTEITQFTRENGLNSNFIYELYKDKQGNIWVGSNENGLNLFTGNSVKFYGEEAGLNSEVVLSIYEDDNGVLWFGTYEGIYRRTQHKIQKIELTKESNQAPPVRDIIERKNGSLLFLTSDNDIYSYKYRKARKVTLGNELQNSYIYDLFEDSKNKLWLGTGKGVFQKNGEQFIRYSHKDGLVGNIVYQVIEHKGDYWIATQDGGSRFDGQHFQNITTQKGLSHKEVRYMVTDKYGDLWIGTGGGISLLSLSEDGDIVGITNFTKDDGFKLTKTEFLWFDDEGNLWQGTDGGLHKLDVPSYRKTGSMQVSHFKLSDIGIGIETNHKAVQKSRNGNNVWLGTVNGALQLNTSQLNARNTSVPVYITDITRNATSVIKENLVDSVRYQYGRAEIRNITFPYGQDTYTFNFTGVNLPSHSNIRYRYKLVGFEDQWSKESPIRQATYTSLEPGKYTFKVQAVTGTNASQANIALVRFTIESPFWQTYWFYSMVFIAFTGIVYAYIRFRVYKFERARLKELVDEQTKDLTEALKEKEVLLKEIHHRVKNNLAVISGLLDLQVGYADDDFVSRVLSESQRRVQSIAMIHEKLYQNERLAEINVEKYVYDMVAIIGQALDHPNKNIAVNVEIDEFTLGVDQCIPAGLILNELISNAYEHAFAEQQNGRLDILVKLNKDTIRLVVADNGQGLPVNFDINENESLGFTLITTLAMQLDGTFKVVDTKKGSQFELQFQKEEASLKVPTA